MHRSLSKKAFPIALWILLSLVTPSVFAADEVEPLHLKAAAPKHFPPQYSVSDDGKPQGFAVDTMEAIAKLANFEIEYIIKESWTEVFEALKNGPADLVPNQGITDRRKQWFSFSIPIETFPVSIFTRKKTNDISNLSTLSEKKVAVVKLNIGEELIKKQPDANVQKYDHVQDALLALLSGNADALIFPDPVVGKMARDTGIDNLIKVVGDPLIEIRRGIAVAKGNDALLDRINTAVRRFVTSKDYQKIYTKWYGRPIPFWTAAKVAKCMTAVLIGVVFLMFFWRYHATVRLNRKLQENIEKRSLAEKELQKAYEELEQRVDERTRDLQEALSQVKTLSGMLPICSHCKKIRDDKGYWKQIEAYIEEHSEAEFSHSICNDCLIKHYPEFHLGKNESDKR